MAETQNCSLKKLKSFPSHKGGADLCFCSPQPDTSQSCKSMDTRLVCLFSSDLVPVPIYTAWWTEAHVYVWRTCPGLYMKQSSRDSNLRPIGCRSDALTTMPPCHTMPPHRYGDIIISYLCGKPSKLPNSFWAHIFQTINGQMVLYPSNLTWKMAVKLPS